MSAATSPAELAGMIVGLILTLFVFSFVLRDNPLSRLAGHLLVGLSAGYVSVVAAREVLAPVFDAVADPAEPAGLLWLVPLVLAGLLLLKLVPRLAWLGNSAMAVLMAVGAAAGLTGAIGGTLLPQIVAGFQDGLVGLAAAILTVVVLGYFHFTGRLTAEAQVAMPAMQRYSATAGRIVLTITLGALYGATLSTTLVLLTERVGFYMRSLVNLVAGLL